MDEILKLQPGEIWVWLYLCKLAKAQKSELFSGTLKVTLPFMRENREVQAVYSARQFLRHLLSLASKNFLMIFNREKNFRCQITVGLAARFYLDMGVQVPGHGCPSRGENEAAAPSTWTPVSKKEDSENPDGFRAGPVYLDNHVQEGHSASASARVIKSLKALIAITDQGILLHEVVEAGNKEELRTQLGRIAPMARGKSLSQASVIYAAIRFVQSGQGKKTPAAWVEGTAKRTERLIRQGGPWKEGSSGSAGRSPYPGESGRSSTYSSGRT